MESSAPAWAKTSSGSRRCGSERIPPTPALKQAATTGAPQWAGAPLEELFGLGRLRGLLEHAPRAAAEITEIERSLVDRLRHSLGEVERVVENDGRRRGVLSHVVQNRALSAAREDGFGDPVDPDARAFAAPALVSRDRLERVDPVGAGPFAEAQEDHASRSVRHARDHRTRPRRYSKNVSSSEYGGEHMQRMVSSLVPLFSSVCHARGGMRTASPGRTSTLSPSISSSPEPFVTR